MKAELRSAFIYTKTQNGVAILCFGISYTVNNGNVNEKVLPSPRVLSAQILPSCCSMILRQMVSPSPVPPLRLESEESTC